jgi:glutamine synthetase
MTFKLVVKSMAKRHGLYASFMPKPLTGVDGSGMHLNMSLWKDGKNIFADSKGHLGISKTGYHFLAGILKYAPEMTLITNPLINSYKRLVPGYEAPIDVTWSTSNRSPLIRIPAARGVGTRLEFRAPDAATNPYLALAVCLAAGLAGIKEGLEPTPHMEGNLYEMRKEDREALGIKSLPRDMRESIRAFKNSTFMREVLGDHIFEKYISAKKAELHSYQSQVTDWEINEYLYKI